MEQFFSGSQNALYFIGLLFLIISNNKNNRESISNNIILLYIIMALVNVFNIINLNISTIIILLICFIDIEILNINNETLIVKTKYKIYDFLFEIMNKYKFMHMYLINFVLNIIINKFEFFFFMKLIIFFVYFLLFIKIITKIYRNEFKLKEFNSIEEKFESNTIGFRYDEVANMQNIEKLNMLIDIEDKTYMYRKRSHSSISIEALMCKINRQQRYEEIIDSVKHKKIWCFIKNIKVFAKYILKIIDIILKAVIYKDGIRRFIKRGYSTIEMQWIRNSGIEIGYDKVYRRKIYELIYSNIFFKSLKEKRKYNTYPEFFYNNSDYIFKMIIIYVYLKTVPTFIYKNGKRVKLDNIYQFYSVVRKEPIENKKNIIYDLSKEEIFIFIMGLSGKKIDDNLFELYSMYIEKYNIDKTKVMEIIYLINN